jgi:hypothetical protein
MKKNVHLIVALALSCLTANATNLFLYDFESIETSPTKIETGDWLFPGSLEIVENPQPDEVNASSKCFTFEAQEGIEWWGGPMITVGTQITTETARYLYFKVLAEDTFLSNFQTGFFIEDGKGGYTELNINLKPLHASPFKTEWQEYCFKIDVGVTFANIRIQPSHWGTYYVDDIRLSDVAPIIPEIQPFKIDFEASGELKGWTTYSKEGQVYKTTTKEVPFTISPIVNNSDSCLRVWVTNGTWSDYGGAKFTDIYGYTSEQSRYLHVKYFFVSNEDHPDQYNLPLRVFTQAGDITYNSIPCIRNQWNDVTIDLGAGNLIQYLGFNIEDWWTTIGIDDIQLDGNPDERANLTAVDNVFGSKSLISFTTQGNSILVKNVSNKTQISIFSLTGNLVKQLEINTSTNISNFNKGVYIIKAVDVNGSIAKKILIN